MTWQQQMHRKQQVIVLFITLTPPEVLLLHQSYQGHIYYHSLVIYLQSMSYDLFLCFFRQYGKRIWYIYFLCTH